MRLSRTKMISALFVTAFGTIGHAAVTTGNFEAGFAGASAGNDYQYLDNGDAITIQGWTAQDDGIEEPSYIMFKTPRYQDNIPQGNYAVYLNAGSSMSTSVSLVAGQAYNLSYFAKASFRIAPDPLQIVIGTHTFSVGDPGGYSSLAFVADVTDAATTLRFQNVSPSSGVRGYALDDISIAAVSAAVPEPESLALVLTGLLAMLAQRRSRRTR